MLTSLVISNMLTVPFPKTAFRFSSALMLRLFIKKNKLQDTKNKRNINADETLKAVFGKGTVNMFEMTKLVSKHLS